MYNYGFTTSKILVCILIDIVQHKLLLIKETQSNVYMEFADILVIDFFILFMKMK